MLLYPLLFYPSITRMGYPQTRLTTIGACCIFKTTTPQSVSLHASFAEVALPFEPVEIQDPVIRCYLALNGPRYLLFDRDNASDDVFWALAPDLGTYTLDTPAT